MFSKHTTDGSHKSGDELNVITPEELEKERVKGAVRTDLILSAEIVAITYATVAESDLVNQIAVMLSVAIFITIAVYGFVALVVKADDMGVYMAKENHSPQVRKVGRGIVKFMPHFLKFLSYVGTAAMLWVGAEIVAHGIPFTSHALDSLEHSLAHLPVLAWFVTVLVSAVGGLFLGALIERIVVLIKKVV